MSEALEATLRRLRAAGHRVTAPRRAILRVLAASDRPLGEGEILARARREVPGLGLATVYRTLDLLVRLGMVQRLHLPDGRHAAILAEGHRHPLVCRRCGRVVRFQECGLEEVIARLEAQTGFRIEAHRLELVGTCGACAGGR